MHVNDVIFEIIFILREGINKEYQMKTFKFKLAWLLIILLNNAYGSIITIHEADDFTGHDGINPLVGNYEMTIRADDYGWLNGGIHTSAKVDMNSPAFIQAKTAIAVTDFVRNHETRPIEELGNDLLRVESSVSVYYQALPFLIDPSNDVDTGPIPMRINWAMGINDIGGYNNDIKSTASASLQIQAVGGGRENYFRHAYSPYTGSIFDSGNLLFDVNNSIEVFMNAQSHSAFNGSPYYGEDNTGWFGSTAWVDPVFEIDQNWEFAHLYDVKYEMDFVRGNVLESLGAGVTPLNPTASVPEPTTLVIFILSVISLISLRLANTMK